MAEPQSQTRKGNPSTSNVLVLAAFVPFGATLLILAGLTLAATPLLVIFTPVLLPAALAVALAIAGFITSGAFGITSLSSFAWLATYLRRSRSPEHLHRAPYTADHVTQKD